jgi:hypothetical protein
LLVLLFLRYVWVRNLAQNGLEMGLGSF